MILNPGLRLFISATRVIVHICANVQFVIFYYYLFYLFCVITALHIHFKVSISSLHIVLCGLCCFL